MRSAIVSRLGLVLILTVLLAACGGSPAPQSVAEQQRPAERQTAPAAPAPTSAPAATATQPAPTASAVPPTSTPAPPPASTTPPTTVPPTAVAVPPDPALADIPLVEGQPVLQLARGSGPQQIGQSDQLPTLRIGGDGSMRILDPGNRRLLFFNQQGALQRTLDLHEAGTPIDFAISAAGDIFVLGQSEQGRAVLHYHADGSVSHRLLVSNKIHPSGIALNADQDLFLTAGHVFWTVLLNGVQVPPEIQHLTEAQGVISPRSPRVFKIQGAGLEMIPPRADNQLWSEQVPQELQSPATMFFNVDRAMDLYYGMITIKPDSIDGAEITVWKVVEDEIQGAAKFALTGCWRHDRQFYIDQAGAAWYLCASDAGVTLTRYTLLGGDGQPLQEAAQQPKDVIWSPGSSWQGTPA